MNTAADHAEGERVQKRMQEASKQLNDMHLAVGLALQVIDYDSDRRKNLLAKHAKPYIVAGESAATAAILARASKEYNDELERIAKQCAEAYQIKTKQEATKVSWETARSTLSYTKATITELS